VCEFERLSSKVQIVKVADEVTAAEVDIDINVNYWSMTLSLPLDTTSEVLSGFDGRAANERCRELKARVGVDGVSRRAWIPN